MRNALQALRRLDVSDRRGRDAAARERARHTAPDGRARETAMPTIGSVGRSEPRGAAAVAGLLERLRAAGAAAAGRIVVIAPVDDGVCVRPVIDALAQRARELAMQIAVADLTRIGGRPMLSEHDGGSRRPLDLDDGTIAPALAAWLERCDTPAMVLVDAPPLVDSADAALLARACTGLVLVAATGVTARAALRAAVDRANAAGCPMLGVVLTLR